MWFYNALVAFPLVKVRYFVDEKFVTRKAYWFKSWLTDMRWPMPCCGGGVAILAATAFAYAQANAVF